MAEPPPPSPRPPSRGPCRHPGPDPGPWLSTPPKPVENGLSRRSCREDRGWAPARGPGRRWGPVSAPRASIGRGLAGRRRPLAKCHEMSCDVMAGREFHAVEPVLVLPVRPVPGPPLPALLLFLPGPLFPRRSGPVFVLVPAGAEGLLFPFELAPPALLDLLGGPGVVDVGIAVAALVEPVMFGPVGPVVVDPVRIAAPAAAGPRAVLIDPPRAGRRPGAGRRMKPVRGSGN